MSNLAIPVEGSNGSNQLQVQPNQPPSYASLLIERVSKVADRLFEGLIKGFCIGLVIVGCGTLGIGPIVCAGLLLMGATGHSISLGALAITYLKVIACALAISGSVGVLERL